MSATVNKRGALARNASANVLEVLVGTALLFALYRYINTALGIEQLGVWSVVLATVSASRLANLGLSASVVRFVARDLARDDAKRAADVVDTAALTLMVTVGLILPVTYPLLERVLPFVFDGVHLDQALEILPYALLSLWLTSIAAVFQGGLDGCQRMDIRAALVVAGQAILLVLSLRLVPSHGLVGLAWAQIGQSLFLVLAGRLFLCRTLSGGGWLPWRLRGKVLREMLVYGANIQAATLFMLLLDPFAKAFMASFGGPAAAGYFEMANKVVFKARSVVIMANKAIVPHVASLLEDGKQRGIAGFYAENMRVVTFFALPGITLLFAWAGAFSWLLTGTYSPEFTFFLGVMCVAWGVNLFTGPAYFTNMGSGEVGWNTLSHLVMGILNITLGWLLGHFYGPHGVLYGYAIALFIGSGVLIVVYQRRNNLSWRDVFAREHIGLALTCLAVAAATWFKPLHLMSGGQASSAAGILLPVVVLGIATWLHPVRRRLVSLVRPRQAEA